MASARRQILGCCLLVFAVIQFNFLYFYRFSSRGEMEALHEKIRQVRLLLMPSLSSNFPHTCTGKWMLR